MISAVAKAFAFVGLVCFGLALALIPAGSKASNLEAAFWALGIAALVVAGIASALDHWKLTPRRTSPRLPPGF
jgi:peptidoglycan/LPS O-acetylase OafA/YrhL